MLVRPFTAGIRLLGRVEIKRLVKAGQAGEQQLLPIGEQIEAPPDAREHSSLVCQAGSDVGSEHPEGQPFSQHVDRNRAQPADGEVNGERQAVKPVAQLGHHVQPVGEIQAGAHGRCLVQEQAHRRRRRVVPAARGRGRQRQYFPQACAGRAQRPS
jgi:hypothetical protein